MLVEPNDGLVVARPIGSGRDVKCVAGVITGNVVGKRSKAFLPEVQHTERGWTHTCKQAGRFLEGERSFIYF